MKLYSPFLLYFTFLSILFSSCNDSKNSTTSNNIVNDSIINYIDISYDDAISIKDRIGSLNKAYGLAQKIHNDSLVFKVVAAKCVLFTSYFPEKSPEALKQLYVLINNGDKARKNDWRLASYNCRRADYFFQKQDYDSARTYYYKSKDLFMKEKDSAAAGYTFVRLADLYTIFNDYNSTQENGVEALKVLKNAKNKGYRSAIYQTLGSSYLGLKQYDSAIANYSKANLITEDSATKRAIMNNLANTYIAMEYYNQAIKTLSDIRKSKLDKDSKEKAAILDNFGYAKFKNGDKSGVVEMEEAMQINQQQKYFDYQAKNYLHFSDYYKDSNKALAFIYAKRAYDAATISQATDDRVEALYKLFLSASGEISRRYGIGYKELKDSITTVREIKNNDFALLKYDSSESKKSAEKSRKEKEIQTLKYQRIGLIIAIGIIVLIGCGVAFHYSYRTKQKKEKLKEIYNTETRISKKLHDELANDIYNVMTYTSTKELSEENKENILNKLDDIYSRTRNISKENASIDTGPAFGFQLKEMIAAYSNKDVNVIINGLEVIDWNTIDPNKKIAVSRVVQELLVNMKKHSQCSFAALTFKKIKNNLHIDYSDNGVGLATDVIILKNGLLNVETRIHAINGTVTFDTTSDKGFRLAIVFPI